MAYMHIDNLYKNDDILLFKRCYALEKIHGTSAHVSCKNGVVHFFSGGVNHENFTALFDIDELTKRFQEIDCEEVTIYGEAYGGKCQGMSKTYGEKLSFIAFEVKIGDCWLNVEDAMEVSAKLGFEFVPVDMVNENNIDILTALRDKDSFVAIRRGMGEGHKKEGIVLRPLIELTKNNGKRIIVKYKRDDFKETKTTRPIDGTQLEMLTKANEIADEWVTEMRLTHVLDKLPKPHTIEQTGDIIKAMLADILREAEGEIVDSKAMRKAVGRATVGMFHKRVKVI